MEKLTIAFRLPGSFNETESENCDGWMEERNAYVKVSNAIEDEVDGGRIVTSEVTVVCLLQERQHETTQ